MNTTVRSLPQVTLATISRRSGFLAENQLPQEPVDRYEPGSPQPPESSPPKVSLFHRATAAVAGAALSFVAAAGAVATLGLAGLPGAVLGLTVLAGGALGAHQAGRHHTTEQATSKFHRATAALTGSVLGTFAGLEFADIMMRSLESTAIPCGLAGLTLGLVAGAVCASKFRDK